jgi:hypothetical protein
MDLSIFEQWVVRIPCAFTLNIVDPIIRAVIIFHINVLLRLFFPLLNLLKNLSNNKLTKY